MKKWLITNQNKIFGNLYTDADDNYGKKIGNQVSEIVRGDLERLFM
ncbi:hypothetical protein MNQ98_22605 [Paenibacillus sp. N3/727]|nr:hypothetical protein [Paenibacillus sp. N3/727]UNK17244.1 hypothetical protein MNQ98_22605 [Paenibacillus sp. N3/727]